MSDTEAHRLSEHERGFVAEILLLADIDADLYDSMLIELAKSDLEITRDESFLVVEPRWVVTLGDARRKPMSSKEVRAEVLDADGTSVSFRLMLDGEDRFIDLDVYRPDGMPFVAWPPSVVQAEVWLERRPGR